MSIQIRRATAGDAEAVREVVLRTLRETNSKAYPVSVIDRLVSTLPERVASNLEVWQSFVAVSDGLVVGTASLNGLVVGSVFVLPSYQRRGVGRMLMELAMSAV